MRARRRTLDSTADAFGGVIVDPVTLGADPDVFSQRLSRSLTRWESAGIRVVWLEVPTDRANLIPVAVDAGFVFHHADASAAVMTKRLSADSYVPPYATHYIGVGGVVVDDADRLLVVSERYRRRGIGRYYKLPGGALRHGEHIADAAIREVREETGVLTRFEALICFRHWHGYRYDRSDIYFICRLSPLTRQIVKQDEEIDECLWMPVQEYLEHEDVSVFNKRVVAAAIGSSGLAPTVIEGYGTSETHEILVPAHMDRRTEWQS